MTRAALTMLLALLLPLPAAAAPAELGVRDAWIRQTPPNRDVAAGYLVLTNPGAETVTLIGAESPAARAELHTMLREDGMMRMRPLERLEIPAGGSAALAPGGAHLMLFGVDATQAGTVIELQLLFEGGESLTVAMPVRRQPPEED